MNFNDFNLDPRIIKNLKALGYVTPTPIQSQSIPPILAGHDLMGLAQTGTGKTAAFGLPMVNRLLTGSHQWVRGLIIAPTRELAQQIHESMVQFCKGTALRSITLYGGVNINPQITALKQGVDIIVACPGRLLDHLLQRTLDVSKIEVLVLDEADHMFDMGFLPDLRKILHYLPKKKQTLLFSATMPDEIHHLANQILHKPIKVQINPSMPSTTVEQVLFPVAKHLKTELLIELLRTTDIQSVLVFTRTKHTAKKLAQKLEQAGFSATSLQGNLSQNKRQSAMKGFRDGSLQILVATDIAARGIDVTTISHVINYDIPSTVEPYIHRIGRTGRAEKLGLAYTLISDEDQTAVRRIEKILGKKLEQRQIENFDYKKVAQTGLHQNHPKMYQRKPQRHREKK